MDKEVTEKPVSVLDGKVKPALTVISALTVFSTAIGLLLIFYFTMTEDLPFDVGAFQAGLAISAALLGLGIIGMLLFVACYPLIADLLSPKSAEIDYEIRADVRRRLRIRTLGLIDIPVQLAAFLYFIKAPSCGVFLSFAVFLIAVVYLVLKRNKEAEEAIRTHNEDTRQTRGDRALDLLARSYGYFSRGIFSGLLFLVLSLLLTTFIIHLGYPKIAPAISAVCLVIYEVLFIYFLDLKKPVQMRTVIFFLCATPLAFLLHPHLGGYVGKTAFNIMKIGGGYSATISVAEKSCQAIKSQVKNKDLDCDELPVSIWLKDQTRVIFSIDGGDGRRISLDKKEILIESLSVPKSTAVANPTNDHGKRK